MVKVKLPSGAVLFAFKVKTAAVVVLLGLNEAVIFFGRPEMDRFTAPLNPLTGLTVMVLVPFFPREMVRLLGAAERLKFDCGAAATISVTEVVCVKFPLVPVMVSE